MSGESSVKQSDNTCTVRLSDKPLTMDKEKD